MVAILKKGSSYLVSNNKPISLLSIFLNILTTHALLLWTYKVQRSIIKWHLQSSCSILDLCKAFDTVDHKLFSPNLEYYGMQAVANDWFASYLSNRRQSVSLFHRNCDCQTVACGVPQGSVLGPLLFL